MQGANTSWQITWILGLRGNYVHFQFKSLLFTLPQLSLTKIWISLEIPNVYVFFLFVFLMCLITPLNSFCNFVVPCFFCLQMDLKDLPKSQSLCPKHQVISLLCSAPSHLIVCLCRKESKSTG